MRKKQLVAIGGLAVLFLLIIIVTQAIGKKAATNALCKDFILNIEKGDATTTYSKFSDNMQSLIPSDRWSDFVKSLKGSYGGTPPELQKRETKRDDLAQRNYIEETYKINNGSGPYTAVCQMISTKQGERIDNFTSKIND